MRQKGETTLTNPARRQVERSVTDRIGDPTKGRMYADENQIVVHTDHDGNKYIVVGGADGELHRILLTRV